MDKLGWTPLSNQEGEEPEVTMPEHGGGVNLETTGTTNGQASGGNPALFVDLPPPPFGGPTLEPPSTSGTTGGMGILPTVDEGPRASFTRFGSGWDPLPSSSQPLASNSGARGGGGGGTAVAPPLQYANQSVGIIQDGSQFQQQQQQQHPHPQHPPVPPPHHPHAPPPVQQPNQHQSLSIPPSTSMMEGGGMPPHYPNTFPPPSATGLPMNPPPRMEGGGGLTSSTMLPLSGPNPMTGGAIGSMVTPVLPPPSVSQQAPSQQRNETEPGKGSTTSLKPPHPSSAPEGGDANHPTGMVAAASSASAGVGEGAEQAKKEGEESKKLSEKERLARLQKFKPGARQLPGLPGVFTLSGEDFANDCQEMARVITQKPPGDSSDEDEDDDDDEDEEDDFDYEEQEEDEAVVFGGRGGYAKGQRYPLPPSNYPSRRGAEYRRAAAARRPAYLMEMDSEDGEEEDEEEEMMLQRPMEEEECEDENQEPPLQPLPVEFVVAEAERQNYDSQYRTLRTTMVRTAQEADAHAKLKGHALKAVQSMCWKQAQLLSARRCRIKILQDIVRAFRKRRDVQDIMEATSTDLREKIERRRAMIKEMGGEEVAGMETDEEEEAESESEESEEEDEEPILKFEHEPLEAGETVLVPDGTDGVIEGIRRGNVVVRTDTALETFKLEEVKRKNIAPPGYVPPQRTKKEKTGLSKEERDLTQAWAVMEDKYNRLDKETDRGLKEALEGFYQESGLEQLMNRDREYEDDYGRGGLGAYSGPQRQKRSREGFPTRPVLFTTAPRSIVPFDVPLIVTPCVDLPDHALAVCYLRDREEGKMAGGGGREKVPERVEALRDSVLSDKFKQWEKDKDDYCSLKTELIQLETRVRKQRQQTDDLNRWVSDGANTNNKLKTQLASLGGDIENLKFKHRCELQIANIPVPEGAELPAVNLPPAMLDEAKLGGSGTALDDDDEEDKAEKRRRLAKEEEEEEMRLEEEEEEQEQAPSRGAFAMRGRGTSFGGRGGRVEAGEEEGTGGEEEEVEDMEIQALLVSVRSGSSFGNDAPTTTGAEDQEATGGAGVVVVGGGGEEEGEEEGGAVRSADESETGTGTRGGSKRRGAKATKDGNGHLPPTNKKAASGKKEAAAPSTNKSQGKPPSGGGLQRRKSSSRGATSGGDSDEGSVGSSSSRGARASSTEGVAAGQKSGTASVTSEGEVASQKEETTTTAAAGGGTGKAGGAARQKRKRR